MFHLFEIFELIFLLKSCSRCDSYGNRPVTATSSSQNRKNNGASGRTRSGSTGNRPQTVNNNRQNHSQPQNQQNSQQVSETN